MEIGRNAANTIPALGEIPQLFLGAEILGGRPIRLSPTFSKLTQKQSGGTAINIGPDSEYFSLRNQLPRLDHRTRVNNNTLLPPSMSSLATFRNVPVSAVFDSNAANSSVSLDWAIHSDGLLDDRQSDAWFSEHSERHRGMDGASARRNLRCSKARDNEVSKPGEEDQDLVRVHRNSFRPN
ncbi:hypothetical protein B0H13DRAFT_1852526 [Mycena leptocephala]|nr:hypothetical protein B0H13DRAFT_1852526 [Mycena leptocephala]